MLRVLQDQDPGVLVPAPGRPRGVLRAVAGQMVRSRSLCGSGARLREWKCEELSRSVGFGGALRPWRAGPVGPETARAALGLNRNATHILTAERRWSAGLPILLFVAWALVSGGPAFARPVPETDLWQEAGQAATAHAESDIRVRSKAFRAVNLQHARLRPLLGRAPKEAAQSPAASDAIIDLPMPDGSAARFRFVESPVMAPELAARFPEIKTYLGRGLDDPSATVRFDLTPAGFHAQILSPRGAVYIEPRLRGNTNLHAAYYRRDCSAKGTDFECLAADSQTAVAASAPAASLVVPSGTLRTYRLACAATAEYTRYFGGTVSAGLAAIVTAINRVTGVYETELGIRLVLVGQNDQLICTNTARQPYSNSSPSALLTQNQATLDAVIGSANYDIGHVFSTAGGGLAAVGVVGLDGLKAYGETGTSVPIGDAFYIDYVAHEIGHQFGATHTFNSSANACGYGSRNAATAYEPGSGSTIMSYAGICGTDNLQRHSSAHFHSASLEQIAAHTTAGSGNIAAAASISGNNAPQVDAGPGYTIPMGTPFTLTATGSDPDDDPLTFCWEERDLGPSITLQAPDNGSSPLFRSFEPTTNCTRTFPQMSDVLSGTNSAGEMLPATSRTLNFRVTARDNHLNGGAVAIAEVQLVVTTNAGPFAVTAPAATATWSGAQTVTWNVAGTLKAPVNVATVTLLLSTNGGLSFPIVLASSVPNTGASTVVLPPVTASAARLKVQADDNIFFAVSPGNFSITPPINPTLLPLQCSNGVVQIAWTALPGRTYRVQYKSSLAAATWTDLQPDITAADSTASTTDAIGSAPQRYYRVLLLP